MSEGRGHQASWRGAVPGVLVFLAFVAPGACLVFTLPPVPIAKALSLATVGIWLLAFGLGLVRWVRPDRRVMWALGAVVAAVLVSFAFGGSPFQVLVYDLYANMPLLQWMAFPALFVMAAGMVCERERLETALVTIVLFGAVLASVEAYQQIATATPRVFGSTGYSKAALAPLIPLGVALAGSRAAALRVALYAAAAVIALDVGVLAGSTMGAIAAAFALLMALLAHPAVWSREAGSWRLVRGFVLALVALMVLVMVWAQIPALSGRWVNPDALASGGTSVVSRLQMWEGAQKMLVERPVFGHGPGGYRISAAEYLPAETLQYGPDLQGNIDPTVFSPQSPHSIFWEMGTRLGLVGVMAFLATLVAWGVSVVERVRSDAPVAAVRRGLAAAFVTALFALTVDPVIFAIGLFAPVAAGLAVTSFAQASGGTAHSRRLWARGALVVAGLAVILVAMWLGTGERRAAIAPTDDPYELLLARQGVLETLPGHPPTHRQVLELRLLLAADAFEVAGVQGEVDSAPSYIGDFAPGLVSLVTYSLTQAERTGRADLSWEDAMLSQAESVLPPIPSLVAERLRYAVLSGDAEAVRDALPDARQWGSPYPFTESYVERAQAVLDSD